MERCELRRPRLVSFPFCSLISFLIVCVLLFSCRPAETPSPKPQPATTEQTAAAPGDEKGVTEPPTAPSDAAATAGRALYLRNCAACHGENGDGKGIAAAFLFPKPRDFGSQFRIVSSTNRMPSREDISGVLLRGMPGSAMPPWAHLSQADRDLLVEEVLRLRREGLKQLFVRQWIEDGEDPADIDENEKAEFVEVRMTPGDPLKTPAFGQPDAASIAAGKETFFKLGCHGCHGKEGKGDGQQEMVNAEGLPTSPRDYTLGIFKGSPDPASLYLRMALGMPGGGMPSTSQATPEQVVELMHYIRSLSTEQQREAAVLKRENITASRVGAIDELVDADAWADVATVGLRMTPLWWRNDAHPDLQVQAAHDGATLALRLSWHDESPDLHKAGSQMFDDAVAVELFGGSAEPFFGMGDPDSNVDVWFWDADRQDPDFTVENEYPRTVVDDYPFSETAVATAEYDRPGTKLAEQPDISLPARASSNQIVPVVDADGGSDLAAGGPGSVTFRIPKNQFVRARGEWQDGRWTVVMTRALAVQSDGGGVELEPGGRASAAFAVWDGSHQDRDGKKSITIWQDLELEQ